MRRRLRVRRLWFAALFVSGCSSTEPTTQQAAFEISPGTANISVGDAQQFSALNARGAVTWNSSNPSVATVVSTGFTTGVGPGTATITATDSRGSATATVVVKRPAALQLSASTLNFSGLVGATDIAAQTVQITDAGDDKVGVVSVAGVAYGAGQPTGWVTASLSGTSAPAQLSVRASATGLAAGTYSATISVAGTGATNGAQTVLVTLNVGVAPVIQLSSSALSFTIVRSTGSAPLQNVAVTNTGGGTLGQLTATVQYTAGQSTGWLTTALSSTTAPTTLSIQPVLGALADGTYNAAVTLAAPGAASRVVTVTLTVVSGPSIGLSNTTLAFSGARGAANAAAQTVQITNNGVGTLSGLTASIVYQAGQATGWLTAILSSTSEPSTLTVSTVTGALADGTYNATINVTAPGAANSPRPIAVTFVVASSPILAVSASTVSFSAALNGAAPPAQTISVTNAGGGSLTGLTSSVVYTAGQPAGWLTTAVLSAATAPSTLTLQPTTAGLASGTYTATVSIASAGATNSPRTVTVTLNVAPPPTLVLGTNALTFSSLRTAASSMTPVTVARLGGGVLTGLTATVNGGAGWLTATLSSTTTPANVTVTVNPAALVPGTYNASISIRSVDATDPQLIVVTFTVLWSYAADIYPAIAPSCTGCHFAGGNLPNLSTATLFYNNLVGVATSVRGGYPLATTHPTRITPGNASTSYVVDEIRKTLGAYPMPTGAATVPQSVIDRFILWINQGALFN